MFNDMFKSMLNSMLNLEIKHHVIFLFDISLVFLTLYNGMVVLSSENRKKMFSEYKNKSFKLLHDRID